MIIPEKFYQEIISVMPIPCVDLLVVDKTGKILLLKRKNEPEKGKWWFPGGRVHFGETRQAADIRKLKEECGLVAENVTEVGTYDVILDMPNMKGQSHGITTLFFAHVATDSPIVLDAQSLEADWQTLEAWMKERLHSFIRNNLAKTHRKDDKQCPRAIK